MAICRAISKSGSLTTCSTNMVVSETLISSMLQDLLALRLSRLVIRAMQKMQLEAAMVIILLEAVFVLNWRRGLLGKEEGMKEENVAQHVVLIMASSSPILAGQFHGKTLRITCDEREMSFMRTSRKTAQGSLSFLIETTRRTPSERY